MNIIYFLIPISLIFVVLFTVAFVKVVQSGQYDDLDGPAYRAIVDNETPIKMKEPQL